MSIYSSDMIDVLIALPMHYINCAFSIKLKSGTKSDIAIDHLPNDIELIIIDEAHHYPVTTWYYFCYS